MTRVSNTQHPNLGSPPESLAWVAQTITEPSG